MLTSAQLLAMTREQAICFAARWQRLLALHELACVENEQQSNDTIAVAQREANEAKRTDREVRDAFGLPSGSLDAPCELVIFGGAQMNPDHVRALGLSEPTSPIHPLDLPPGYRAQRHTDEIVLTFIGLDGERVVAPAMPWSRAVDTAWERFRETDPEWAEYLDKMRERAR